MIYSFKQNVIPEVKLLKRVSILNHVIGPVMRGPSSSHTAGPWRIGRMARELLGARPVLARFYFHPSSSLAVCYHDQGSDRAFIAGLLEIPLTSSDFECMLEHAPLLGLDARFELHPFPEADHPNSSLLILTGENGKEITLHSRSVGGGSFEIASLNGYHVSITGENFETLIETSSGSDSSVLSIFGERASSSRIHHTNKGVLFHLSTSSPVEPVMLDTLAALPGTVRLFSAPPVMHPLGGDMLFSSAEEAIIMAERDGLTLGEAALRYEAALLGRDESSILSEMEERLEIMLNAVHLGLSGDFSPMKLLLPVAGTLAAAERKGALFLGGPHARAAIRSMAALHTNASGGVVCAAPTGGAAGVLPGVLTTLTEDLKISRKAVLMALWAAGGIGLFHDIRSTFAAEVAGCQVEIGAAGAMAAAAVVEAAGGSARQGCDAAATVFQNMMGSVCDLVQGVVEIPCHSRNAALASQAFLCADLVLGGYRSPVPLDETIDAVDSTGRMLPEELRCTSRGGLALCPSAQRLPRLDKKIS